MELPPLTVLNQRYTVKRTLDDPGSFSITYLGEDKDGDDEVFVREFFPAHLVARDDGTTSVGLADDEAAEAFDAGREYFRKESEVLAGLRHEALPDRYDTFSANGTDYRVRRRPSGVSLTQGLDDRGTLPEKAALAVMIPVLGALQEAHENGLYHGGVSPHSIRLLGEGEALLTGFRGAFFQLARESGAMTDLVQPGTSAVEQYTPRGQQGPWTDVYGAAATICQMVTGASLPESTDRLEGDDGLEALVQDADVFSAPGVRETLVDALMVDPSKRLQSVEALRSALTESSTRYAEDAAAYSILPSGPAETGEPAAAEDEAVEVLSTETTDAPAAPASTGAASDDDSGRAAFLIGIPVLLLALSGGAWFMMSAGSTSSAASGAYQEYRTRADSLFETGDYETAEFLYNQALEARGDDQHVQRRLEKLEQIQQQDSKQYQELLRRGNRIKATADSLFDAGAFGEATRQYSRALGAYYTAQNANPENETAQERIEAVQQRQEQIAKRQAGGEGESGSLDVDQLAEFFRDQGDRQLEAGNLQAALDKYRQAAEYSPDNQELQTAIADLEGQIREQEQRSAFQARYNEGQEHLRAGEYEAARADFQRAAEIYPQNPDLLEALEETNALLKKRRRRTEQYEQYRARGDSLFDAGDFEAAVASYKNALEIRSDDEYVQRRIAEADRELEELRLAQEEMEEQQKRQEKLVGEDGVYKSVDQPPKVEGGLASLTQDATYPTEAREQGLEGRVYVEAVVNPDGSVREAKVLRGLGEALDQEALRVVKNATFTPGTYNGEPVRARKTVWIQFQLQNQ
jgi:TonB family protein